jgi:hypothetical protein
LRRLRLRLRLRLLCPSPRLLTLLPPFTTPLSYAVQARDAYGTVITRGGDVLVGTVTAITTEEEEAAPRGSSPPASTLTAIAELEVQMILYIVLCAYIYSLRYFR